jgi:hypothetical protein
MSHFGHILGLERESGSKTHDLGVFASNILLKCLGRYRNSPDLFAVTFYERHLWAGLLGWPD